jgi:hypothetical protein
MHEPMSRHRAAADSPHVRKVSMATGANKTLPDEASWPYLVLDLIIIISIIIKLLFAAVFIAIAIAAVVVTVIFIYQFINLFI